MTGHTATELLPFDLAVPGLWWVKDSGGRATVWCWHPGPRFWSDTLGGRIQASSAHAAGWRCVEPAVPPSGQDAPEPAAEAPPAGSAGAGGGDGPAAELRDRIARAVACLNAAPDPAGDPTWQEVAAIVAANRVAWVVLTEAQSPEPVEVPMQTQGRMPGKREGR